MFENGVETIENGAQLNVRKRRRQRSRTAPSRSRTASKTIENGAETIENGAETIANSGENDRNWCWKRLKAASKTAPKTIESGPGTKHLKLPQTARPSRAWQFESMGVRNEIYVSNFISRLTTWFFVELSSNSWYFPETTTKKSFEACFLFFSNS